MAVDLMAETLIALCDVAARYPARNGRRKHVGVVRRWVRVGSAGVRLEAVQLAGHWYTSEQALARFHAAVARERRAKLRGCAKASARAKQARDRPAAQRAKAHEGAAAFLRRRGVGV